MIVQVNRFGVNRRPFPGNAALQTGHAKAILAVIEAQQELYGTFRTVGLALNFFTARGELAASAICRGAGWHPARGWQPRSSAYREPPRFKITARSQRVKMRWWNIPIVFNRPCAERRRYMRLPAASLIVGLPASGHALSGILAVYPYIDQEFHAAGSGASISSTHHAAYANF